VDLLSVPMAALYPATRAMREATQLLQRKRDLDELAELGVSWSEFNDIAGFRKWRQMEEDLAGNETSRKEQE